MEHGIVRDWNDMERIWQYIYSKEQLQTFSEEVLSVVCADFSFIKEMILSSANVTDLFCF
jgi:hypothetical protein